MPRRGRTRRAASERCLNFANAVPVQGTTGTGQELQVTDRARLLGGTVVPNIGGRPAQLTIVDKSCRHPLSNSGPGSFALCAQAPGPRPYDILVAKVGRLGTQQRPENPEKSRSPAPLSEPHLSRHSLADQWFLLLPMRTVWKSTPPTHKPTPSSLFLSLSLSFSLSLSLLSRFSLSLSVALSVACCVTTVMPL